MKIFIHKHQGGEKEIEDVLGIFDNGYGTLSNIQCLKLSYLQMASSNSLTTE